MHKEFAPFAAYEAVLFSLKNPRGERICYSPSVIRQLWDLHADISDLVALFQLKDDQDHERFFAHAVVTFITYGGYTTKELVQVAKLIDHVGNPILRSSNQFYEFMKMKRSITDAQKIAAIKDSDGLTIFRNDSIGGNFNGFEAIGDALNRGITPESVEKLVQLRDHNDTTLFRTPREIIRFLEYQGSVQFAQKLSELIDHTGNPIFDAFTIALYKQYQDSLSLAQKLVSFKDTKGQTVFSDGKAIINLLYTNMSDKNKWLTESALLQRISHIVSLHDTQKQTLFRDGKDIVDVFEATRGDLKQIAPYIAIINDEGHTYFKGYEISLLLKYQVPAQYAETLTKQGLNAHTILYYYHLGVTNGQTEFENSGKPKALIIYPTDDPDYLSMHAFRDDSTFTFLKTLQDHYDCKIRAVSSVTELLIEIAAANETYFLVIGGHGQQTTLRFGRSNPKYDVYIDDSDAQLTPDHTQLTVHFSKLPLLHTILLDSCFSGQGENNAVNMVNYIANQAPGVNVIGSTEPTNARRTSFVSFVPPNIQCIGLHSYTNSTYTSQIIK